MKKIRKLLDEHYYQLTQIGDNQWKLYEKYDGWVQDLSDPIMTSENNTYEELYDFVKTHRVIKVNFNKLFFVILICALILQLFNMFILHQPIITGLVLGINLVILLYDIIDLIIGNSKHKLLCTRVDEMVKRFDQKYNNVR